MQGKIIAFSGLSGSGKSTMARMLAAELGAYCFVEPEESLWPPIITQRSLYGPSAAMIQLRQFWVQQFVDAAAKRDQGRLVFVDTYFLKITSDYLNKPGMEWLVPADDPYLPILTQLFELDQKIVPQADCVVLFDVTLDNWQLLLRSRGRQWDTLPGFAESYHRNKTYIDEATKHHCTNNTIPLLTFVHEYGDRMTQMLCLKSLLVDYILRGVL